MPNRICIFAHYDSQDLVDPYVIYYLKGLRKVCSRLVFVSTCQLSNEEIGKVSLVVDKVITRENSRYDFGSWQTGIHTEDIYHFDELVICNDSCYAPLVSFEETFQRMASLKCDFWGMSFNRMIRPHIQSYFLVFRQRAMRDVAFTKFWNSIESEKRKIDIIEKYEVGLTQQLQDAGLQFKTAFRWQTKNIHRLAKLFTRRVATFPVKIAIIKLAPWLKYSRTLRTQGFRIRKLFEVHLFNPTHDNWREMLDERIPVVKVDLLRDNPTNADVSRLWREIETLNPELARLIRAHLQRIKK